MARPLRGGPTGGIECERFSLLPTRLSRRVGAAGPALGAYAACDPRAEIHREAYLSAFTYGEDFRSYLAETGSCRGFAGPCWSPWVWWDLDSPDDVSQALADARRLVAHLLQRYPVLDEEDLLVFFSGSKGFHVGLPTFWCPAPSLAFPRVARRFAEEIAGECGASIDAGVYDRVRCFRAPNSRHPKTGLHKRRFAVEELLHLTAERIRRLAERPEPFGLPEVNTDNGRAALDWSECVRAVEQEAEEKARRRADGGCGPVTLNRATLAFICDGAGVGDRHRLLFSAAANLAEFGCPPALAHALLTEAALDSGLPPREVARQIDCGLAHAPAPTTEDSSDG
jgi:hypothetical protein